MKKLWFTAACIITGITILTGCSSEKETFQQKTYIADKTQVQSIRIDVRDRKVEIETSKDDQITVTFYENDKEFYEISAENNTLNMTYKYKKEWTDFIGGKTSAANRTIHLQIPENILSSLEIITTNEDILIPSLSVRGYIGIDVNNGNIKFGTFHVGAAVSLNVKNGNITGSIAGGYEDFTISSKIKKGKCNLPEQAGSGAKKMTVSANNGDINIQFKK